MFEREMVKLGLTVAGKVAKKSAPYVFTWAASTITSLGTMAFIIDRTMGCMSKAMAEMMDEVEQVEEPVDAPERTVVTDFNANVLTDEYYEILQRQNKQILNDLIDNM